MSENQTKTVRIRVPLLVDSDGKWWSTGWHSAKSGEDEDVLYDMSADKISDMYALKWLEADIEVPQQQVVKAGVSDAQ